MNTLFLSFAGVKALRKQPVNLNSSDIEAKMRPQQDNTFATLLESHPHFQAKGLKTYFPLRKIFKQAHTFTLLPALPSNLLPT